MFQLNYSAEQKTVRVKLLNALAPEETFYRDADARFFYSEQIVEIHASGKFVSILPLGQTLVIFE